MAGRSTFRTPVYATARCAVARDLNSRQYRHFSNAERELSWCTLKMNAGFAGLQYLYEDVGLGGQ
jgi:hypothetical protein